MSLGQRPAAAAFFLIVCALPCAGTAPVPADGLVLDLDAGDRRSLDLDGSTVRAWTSRVMPRARLVATPGSPPTYVRVRGRRPVVRFSGGGALCDPAFGREAATWTLVAVVAPAANRGSHGGICAAAPPGGDDFDPGFTVDLYASGAKFDQLSVEGAGRIGGARNQLTAGHPYGSMHVIVVQRAESAIRLWVDGQAQQERPVTPAVTRMGELRVGARHYGGRERHAFHGDVARLLLYTRTLAEPERALIERAMQVTGRERTMEQSDTARRAAGRMVAPTVVRRWSSVDAFIGHQRQTGASPASWDDVRAMPVRTDVRGAIGLGMRAMNSKFDRDRDDEPYFYSNCRADGTGVLLHSVNIGIPHVVGRALLATIAGEAATGIPFPADGLAIFERYLRSSFDNPDHLNSYMDPARENRRFVEFHNMREGLYGLVALVEGRHSAWAREKADRMLETLDSVTDASGLWSMELAAKRGMADRCEGVHPVNSGRMVDPLLAYHRLTGSVLALKLAGLYGRQAMTYAFETDGRFRPMEASSGHVHSITSTLSGVTAYAIHTGDAELLAWCRRAVDRGVPAYFASWGWGDEVMPEHPADEVLRGEMNQTGDVIRTALLLGRAVDPVYFELAERYLRSMVLPTQHREPELRKFVRDAVAPRDDSERSVVARTVGGYAMQLPNDRMREGDWPLDTIDITSGTVHAMAECLRSVVTVDGDIARLNLLLDCDTDAIAVTSRLPFEGRVEFTARSARVFAIRVPPWVDRRTLKLRVDGRARRVVREGAYVRVEGLSPGVPGELSFRVPCKVERETVDGTQFTVTWVGNQVIAFSPRGVVSPLPF